LPCLPGTTGRQQGAALQPRSTPCRVHGAQQGAGGIGRRRNCGGRSQRADTGKIRFDSIKFEAGHFEFTRAVFSGATVDFRYAQLSGDVGETGMFGVTFYGSKFSAGRVSFADVRFPRGRVSFAGAEFCGSEVDFSGAMFSGGTVDFSMARDWSNPPKFPWTDTPTAGVKLPRGAA
jgi:uncharacterized protein YjbI with pentapeptide repeats